LGDRELNPAGGSKTEIAARIQGPCWRISRRRPREVPCLIVLVCLLGGIAIPLRAQASAASEYQVKAAFLYNFARFVEWPGDVLPSPEASIVLCVYGEDPFGPALDEMVKGKSINNRDLAIHRAKNSQELKGCQVVFIDGAESKRLPEILGALQGSSVLLVGESNGFAEQGGQIQFLLEDNKVRFSINVDAVERAHLKMSSKLLALAKIVHDGNRSK
jgi:hypothetical protein